MKNLKNKSGKLFEDEVERYLIKLGLPYRSQYRIGQTLFGRDLISDFVIEWDKYLITVECKHQATRGSAEEKIYYTAHSIINLHNQYDDLITVLIMSGGGWSVPCIQYMKEWAKTQPIIITTPRGLMKHIDNNMDVWINERQQYVKSKLLQQERD